MLSNISSSVIPFSSCPQSFPASRSFQMSQLFTLGGQSIGVSASISVLPMNPGLISFRMDWLDLLAVQGTLKSLLQSDQISRSVVSNSLRPHELQHTRPPCPSPTPGVHSNPCPSSRRCHQPSHPRSSPSPPALSLSQHQGLFK